MENESAPLPLARLTLEVTWPRLSCFACSKTFEPIKPPLLFPPHRTEPPTPTVNLVWSESAQGYSIAGLETEEKALERADACGWRKVTVYGRTIYICPECRKKRTRPKWEQRLTEPVLLGALVLKPPPSEEPPA